MVMINGIPNNHEVIQLVVRSEKEVTCNRTEELLRVERVLSWNKISNLWNRKKKEQRILKKKRRKKTIKQRNLRIERDDDEYAPVLSCKTA